MAIYAHGISESLHFVHSYSSPKDEFWLVIKVIPSLIISTLSYNRAFLFSVSGPILGTGT
jgi:hypothetical protein